jgi:hypothetical protein
MKKLQRQYFIDRYFSENFSLFDLFVWKLGIKKFIQLSVIFLVFLEFHNQEITHS